MTTHRLLYLPLIFIFSLCISTSALSHKSATKFKPPKVEKKDKTLTVSEDPSTRFLLDSIRPYIIITGYDKAAAAQKESFFVANNWTRFISGLKLEISYFTLDSVLLHRRNEEIGLSLPPGERRKVDIRTWDTQHNFVYEKSRESRTPATPYIVKIKIKSVYTPKE